MWEALTAEDLAKASLALAGTSAGVDGWSGDDLAALPFSVWRQLVPLFFHFETYGLVPSTWVLIRQVHLPKAGKGVRAQDNAVRADALRPVSVLSAWWRLWGRARLRSRCMSAWISHWWPDDFYGGRQGVSTSDALLPILQSVDEGFYIGSLDFSLAFDSTNPVIPLHVFHQLGMPVGISNMLSSVWCHQARFLQLAGDTDPSPCYVSASLPQGDAMSMLGLAATLLGPHLDLKRRFPSSVFATYVDDRTFACPSAGICVDVATAWHNWSNFLNLRENSTKLQFFHRTVSGRRCLVRSGAPPDRVLCHPKLLGVQLIPAAGRSITDDDGKRFRRATVLARKCSYLPHPGWRKCFFAAATAIAVVKWGWLVKVPPKKAFAKLEAAPRRCAVTHAMGDPSLCKIMRGHLCSLILLVFLRLSPLSFASVRSTADP